MNDPIVLEFSSRTPDQFGVLEDGAERIKPFPTLAKARAYQKKHGGIVTIWLDHPLSPAFRESEKPA